MEYGPKWYFFGKAVCGFGFLFALLVFIPQSHAQEPILLSYQRNFVRANLSTKANILQDALSDDRSGEFIGQLYEIALNFILQNADLFRNDPEMITLAGIACRGAGKAGYKASAETLWKIFTVYHDSLTRVEVLSALAILGKGNIPIVENINRYLTECNRLFLSGIPPDLSSVSAAVSALGNLGDKSSFQALFSVMTAGYSAGVGDEAARALTMIDGDYKHFLVDVLKKNVPTEKLAAFKAGLNNKKFSEKDRAELVETALQVSLEDYSGSRENEDALRGLRYLSIPVITELKWTRATAQVIKHYYRVQTDYGEGKADKAHLLEAIRCLAAMGNSEAAQVLILQLGFFNSQTERNGGVDEQITLAVIHALGEIGDKAAFDYLLYIGYLTYPDTIQLAAKEALNRLKW
ncbi:MAG: HEAT repeat domain-containing protein [Treponema sp.]|jgi:HEAT repeat protein|nr:HEAT repeat domain-containing protein [Treponema sp.]